jgi:hypothetical protein
MGTTMRCTSPLANAFFSVDRTSLTAFTLVPFAPYASAHFTKSGLLNVIPESGNWSTACFQRIMLVRESRQMRLPCASPRQDDFAKWPILNQMPQGFVRHAEGIDALDDRLN